MRDQLELRVLVKRLIENRFENRLRIRCETLIGVPGRNVVRLSCISPPVGFASRDDSAMISK